VTDLPIDRIAEAVQPSESQRAALDALREASTNAAASLKADCPTYQVLTPVGRTEAMEQRLAGTLTAVKTVEPALTKFYDVLSDEQGALQCAAHGRSVAGVMNAAARGATHSCRSQPARDGTQP
jgi:hypothetical protein